MKKTFLTIAASFAILFFFSTYAKAQNWLQAGTGLSSSTPVCIVDLSMPKKTVGWGIYSFFSGGSCGGIVPYTTRTIDGTTWIANTINDLPTNATPTSIFALNKDTAWITATDIANAASGVVMQTVDGGVNWHMQIGSEIPDAANFIHFFNANDGVMVGDSSVLITHNGGLLWLKNGHLPPNPIGLGKTSFLVNSNEVIDSTIWIGDVYGYFYKSTDKGNTWELLKGSINPSSIKGIAFKNKNFGMAVASQWQGGGSGSSGGSFVDYSVSTKDGGVTWQPMPIQFYSNICSNLAAKYDVAYIPGSVNSFVVSSEINSTISAFTTITHDGGLTWTLIDSTERHTAMVFFDKQTAFTGGYIPTISSGIYKLNTVLNNNSSAVLNIANEIELSIYPNPTEDKINIEATGFNIAANSSLHLINIMGEEVMMKKIITSTSAESMDISLLPKGIYFLQLKTNSEVIFTKKIVR